MHSCIASKQTKKWNKERKTKTGNPREKCKHTNSQIQKKRNEEERTRRGEWPTWIHSDALFISKDDLWSPEQWTHSDQFKWSQNKTKIHHSWTQKKNTKTDCIIVFFSSLSSLRIRERRLSLFPTSSLGQNVFVYSNVGPRNWWLMQ